MNFRRSALFSLILSAAILRTGLHAYSVLAGPATRPAVDPWVGTYRRLGDQLRVDDQRAIRIEKVDGAYHLHGTAYDAYEFTETAPEVLWDRKKVLGTISLGTLTSAPGPLGKHPPITVLTVEFCYEFYYLFRDPEAPATLPSNPE